MKPAVCFKKVNGEVKLFFRKDFLEGKIGLKPLYKSASGHDFSYFKNWALSTLKKQYDTLKSEAMGLKEIEEVTKGFRFVESEMKKAFPVGTIRTWKGKKFIKSPDKKWRPYYDERTTGKENSKENLGRRRAILAIAKKINALQDGDYKGLYDIIQANKDRFFSTNSDKTKMIELYEAMKEKGAVGSSRFSKPKKSDEAKVEVKKEKVKEKEEEKPKESEKEVFEEKVSKDEDERLAGLIDFNGKAIKDKDGKEILFEHGLSSYEASKKGIEPRGLMVAIEKIYNPENEPKAGKETREQNDRITMLLMLLADAVQSGIKVEDKGVTEYKKNGISVFVKNISFEGENWRYEKGKEIPQIVDVQIRSDKVLESRVRERGGFPLNGIVWGLGNSMIGEKHRIERDWRESIINKENKANANDIDIGIENIDIEDDFKTERNYNSNLAKSIGKEYYDEMHDVIDKCENKYARKLWSMFESKIGVVETKYKGREFYDPDKRGICINIKKNSLGESIFTPYGVVIHESGHAIDHAIGGFDEISERLYVLEEGKNGNKEKVHFEDMIKREVNDYVNTRVKEDKKDFEANINNPEYLHEKGYIEGWLAKNMRWDLNEHGEYKTYKSWVKYKKQCTQNAISKELKNMPPKDQADVSDLFSGVTRNRACGNGHHSNNDWQRNGALANEGFADMLEATVCNKNSVELLKKYMPKSYEMFEKIIKKLTIRKV